MTTIGIILLTAGIVAFMVSALSGANLVWLSFFLLMSSLLFFNLPTVVARRRERARDSDPSDGPRP